MARTTSNTGTEDTREGELRFGLLNWVLLGAAVLAIVGGYAMLAGGSTVAAPMLLVIGYVILMPLGIILEGDGHGRLAQLVQSTSFTPRGSGVRIPQRPSHRPDILSGLSTFGPSS